MSDYIKQLENQNEELQKKLAEDQIWKPRWLKVNENAQMFIADTAIYAAVVVFDAHPFKFNVDMSTVNEKTSNLVMSINAPNQLVAWEKIKEEIEKRILARNCVAVVEAATQDN